MPRIESREPILIPGKLVSVFLRRVLAAGAGVEPGRQSISKLGKIAAWMRYSDYRNNLHTFFDSLKPYRRFGNFQGLAMLPRPKPLRLHVEAHILYGHFRAWLRRMGIDPDTVAFEDCSD